jgi:hypothetical protein
VSECNREPSKMRRLWPTRGCCAMGWEGILLAELGVFHILQKFMIIMGSEGLNHFYVSHNISRIMKSRRMCGVRLVVHIKTSGRKSKRRRPLGRTRSTCEVNIKMDLLNEWSVRTCTGVFWPTAGNCDGLLCTRWRTINIHKMRRISWLDEELLASQELRVLCCVKLASGYDGSLARSHSVCLEGLSCEGKLPSRKELPSVVGEVIMRTKQ